MENIEQKPIERWTEKSEGEVRNLYKAAKNHLEIFFDAKLTPIEAVRLRHIIREQVLPVVKMDQSLTIKDGAIHKLERAYGDKWYENPEAMAVFNSPEYREEADRDYKQGVINLMVKLQQPELDAVYVFIRDVWGISDIDTIQKFIYEISEGKTLEERERIREKYRELIQNIRLENRGQAELKE